MAVEEVGCADNVLAKEGSADKVVVEEKGSAEAPEEPCLPAAIGPQFGLDSAEEWPTGMARCASSIHRV